MVKSVGHQLTALGATLQETAWTNPTHRYNAMLAIEEVARITVGVETPAWTQSTTDELVKSLRESGNSDATINRKLSFVRRLFLSGYKEGLLDVLPLVRRLPETPARRRILSTEEANAILRALSDGGDYFSFASFLLDTGASPGEAKSLRWTDITHRHVTFWSSDKSFRRSIPLTDCAFAAVQFRPDLPVGPFAHIELRKFRAEWKRAKDRCGFTDDQALTPIVLKYTCEARLLEAGVDVATIHKWFGYRTPRTSERYPVVSGSGAPPII